MEHLDPISIFAVLAATAIVLAALGMGLGANRQLDKRIAKLKGELPHDLQGKLETRRSLRKSETLSSNPILDKLLSSLLPRPEMLRLRLEQAGVPNNVGKFLMISIACGAIITVIAATQVAIPPVGLVALFAATSLGVPHFLVSYLIKRRSKKFVANFAETIELLVRGIKSGLPIAEAMRTAAEEMPDPIGQEFQRITEATAVGKNLEDAMWDAAERIDLPEFDFLVVAMSIQRETGGNLAETLQNLATLLRRRRQTKLKIRALASEAKTSAYIIGSLPFLMIGIILSVNPEYIMQLIEDERGHMMIAVGAGMFLVGVFAMWRMVRFEI